MLAQNLLENKHFIRSMEDIMEVLHISIKGSNINTIVKFNIYNETKFDNQSLLNRR